ncbi:alpha/beta hydrolase family protein [Francisella salimarina]|uniref:alpha/beta hydrolase family protein n=1 Tax=Francisella salimarina TaxID=2599927 RepID=UPI003D81429B
MRDIKYIKDTKGNILRYKLNLCDTPYGAPLFIVLHGHRSTMTNFRYNGWNVLSPLDNYGYKSEGSWWLGEFGNFFLKDLLQSLIEEISTEYQCKNNIYIYGSSMGGYGAILHGILCGARAIYANVPQIRFNNTKYFSHHYEIKRAIFGDDCWVKESDLTNFIYDKGQTNYPLIFICDNVMQDDYRMFDDYLNEHFLYFLNSCISSQTRIHAELMPGKGHDKIYGLKQVIAKFEELANVERGFSGYDMSNLNRGVRQINGKIRAYTETYKGFEQAFYLTSGEKIYKKLYTSSESFDFPQNGLGEYCKLDFFYKNIFGNIYTHTIKFRLSELQTGE